MSSTQSGQGSGEPLSGLPASHSQSHGTLSLAGHSVCRLGPLVTDALPSHCKLSELKSRLASSTIELHERQAQHGLGLAEFESVISESPPARAQPETGLQVGLGYASGPSNVQVCPSPGAARVWIVQTTFLPVAALRSLLKPTATNDCPVARLRQHLSSPEGSARRCPSRNAMHLTVR